MRGRWLMGAALVNNARNNAAQQQQINQLKQQNGGGHHQQEQLKPPLGSTQPNHTKHSEHNTESLYLFTVNIFVNGLLTQTTNISVKAVSFEKAFNKFLETYPSTSEKAYVITNVVSSLK